MWPSRKFQTKMEKTTMNTDDIGITQAQYAAADMAIDGPKPSLAEVKSIYTTESNSNAVARGLRELADQVEANTLDLGAVDRLVVVYSNDDGEGVCAFGDIKGDSDVYFLFGLGQRCVLEDND